MLEPVASSHALCRPPCSPAPLLSCAPALLLTSSLYVSSSSSLHLAAQREAGILEQVLVPLRRRGDGRSGGEARRLLDELADAGAALHDLLLRRSLGPST